MSAIKKEELEKLEKDYGLEPDGLSYQHRCSRIAAYIAGEGESWTPPKKEQRQTETHTERLGRQHPLFGKKILISPMMVPDRNRNVAYDEVLGPELRVREANAGEMLYESSARNPDLDRMVGDYVIEHRDETHMVTAKTTFPKIGTEISIRPGIDLVPVVRGNDGQEGYIWSFPTSVRPVEDTDGEVYMIQLYGLKALITTVFPELIPRFSGKPMMTYIDGITLAASIPMTTALLKEQRRRELADAKAGLY